MEDREFGGSLGAGSVAGGWIHRESLLREFQFQLRAAKRTTSSSLDLRPFFSTAFPSSL